MPEPLLHPSYLRWLERFLLRRTPRGGAQRPALRAALAPPRTPAELERIASRALRASGDRDLGLVLGGSIPVSGHGPLAALLGAAPTLGHALEDLVRFAPLRAPGLRFELRQKRGGSELRLLLPPGLENAERLLAQALAALLERLCEQLLGEPASGLEHRFPWPGPETSAYRRHLRAATRFGGTHYALWIPRALLAAGLPGADPQARRAARQLCEKMLAQREGLPLATASAAVERLLWQADWRWPSLGETARTLLTSVRSLQRALAREGTTFRALCERVRGERAREMLTGGNLPVAVVAERLGYRDPGNFARAVRRWAGASPRALRRRPPSRGRAAH